MTANYTWTDNPTKVGESNCDPDILNECLMHLKYNLSGGVSKFSDLGVVAEDKTLESNVITLANYIGNHAVNLPDITDTAKQTTCIFDFATSNTAYPTLNKYKALTGTIAVTNGSATVTGTGTKFTTELQVGDRIPIAGVEYQVKAFDATTPDSLLTLTANYAGTTASGLSTSRNLLRWTDKTQGAPPNGWAYVAGVRNLLTFKSIWENGLLYWETEYTPIGLNTIPLAQPVLSDAGTLGSTTRVACYCPNNNDGMSANSCLDGNNSSTWVAPSYNTPWIISFPKPTLISQFRMYMPYYPIYTGVWYASIDNASYVPVATVSNSGTDYTLGVPTINQGFYRYFKFIPTSGAGSTAGRLYELYLTGQQINQNYTV